MDACSRCRPDLEALAVTHAHSRLGPDFVENHVSGYRCEANGKATDLRACSNSRGSSPRCKDVGCTCFYVLEPVAGSRATASVSVFANGDITARTRVEWPFTSIPEPALPATHFKTGLWADASSVSSTPLFQVPLASPRVRYHWPMAMGDGSDGAGVRSDLHDPATFSRHLGATIASLRAELGLSRKALADEADLTAEGLRKVEVGRCVPTAHTLWRLANALRIPLGLLGAQIERRDPEPLAIDARVWSAALQFAQVVASKPRSAQKGAESSVGDSSAALDLSTRRNGTC